MKPFQLQNIKFIEPLLTSTYMFKLYEILKEKHGKMAELAFFDAEDNEYDEVNKNLTLSDIFGTFGSLEKETAETVQIFYDFVPCNIHDPVLLT